MKACGRQFDRHLAQPPLLICDSAQFNPRVSVSAENNHLVCVGSSAFTLWLGEVNIRIAHQTSFKRKALAFPYRAAQR